MSRSVKPLFLSALVLSIMVQLTILHFSAGTVFFTTWFIFLLVVRHDVRLSSLIGIFFLITSLILRILKVNIVAQLGDYYAFIFLGIGVAVQGEELLLQHYRRLHWKLDFTDELRPITSGIAAVWSRWSANVNYLLINLSRKEFVKLVQIVGASLIMIFFLGVIIFKQRQEIIYSLMIAAVLFPFAVWLLRNAFHYFEKRIVQKFLLAVIILPLAAAEMILFYNIIQSDNNAHLRGVYLIDYLDAASLLDENLVGQAIERQIWTIDNKTEQVLFQHPGFITPSRLSFSVIPAKNSVLTFDVAMSPDCWNLIGDGVVFSIYVKTTSIDQVFSTYIDPKNNPSQRHWNSFVVDLKKYAGQEITIIFETDAGPYKNSDYDWAGWGNLGLLYP